MPFRKTWCPAREPSAWRRNRVLGFRGQRNRLRCLHCGFRWGLVPQKYSWTEEAEEPDQTIAAGTVRSHRLFAFAIIRSSAPSRLCRLRDCGDRVTDCFSEGRRPYAIWHATVASLIDLSPVLIVATGHICTGSPSRNNQASVVPCGGVGTAAHRVAAQREHFRPIQQSSSSEKRRFALIPIVALGGLCFSLMGLLRAFLPDCADCVR